jgi:hypothetical protein
VTVPAAEIASTRDSLLAAYEELRRQILGASEIGRPGPGLALLLSRGMQEWMQACMQFFRTAPEKRAEEKSREEPLPASLRAEVVVLLAGMLLQRSRTTL